MRTNIMKVVGALVVLALMATAPFALTMTTTPAAAASVDEGQSCHWALNRSCLTANGEYSNKACVSGADPESVNGNGNGDEPLCLTCCRKWFAVCPNPLGGPDSKGYTFVDCDENGNGNGNGPDGNGSSG